MKKVIILVLAVAAVLYFNFSGNLFAQEKMKVGIVKFSNLPHYNAALKGILKEFKARGLDESKVVLDIRDADGKKDKVIEIAKDFKAKGMNLIMPIGTPAAVGVFKEVNDIPIVFSTVFDPISSGIAKTWESPGTNATGSSTWVEMSAILGELRKILKFKVLGVIYTKEEMHSVIQFEECNKLQEKMGFTIIPVNFSQISDIKNVQDALVGKADAIYAAGSTPITKNMSALIEITNPAKIPMVSYLAERVEQGSLLAVSTNSIQLGEIAGRKAALVLGGAKPSEMPIEKGTIFDISINLNTAAALGLKVPEEMVSAAAKVIKD
ncbi:MAG: ABC transporter substrate-binding protein [Candidatus Omnitrophota bacterium]